MNEFGENLKHIMEEKNISSYELSNLCLITKGYISKLTNHKGKNPTLSIICKLCKALNVTPNDLIPRSMWENDGIIYSEGSIKNTKD